MHYSALLGAGMEDARNLGWNVDVQEESKHAPSHNWYVLYNLGFGTEIERYSWYNLKERTSLFISSSIINND